MKYSILTTNTSADYELIDSGEGEKLERYGKYVLSRPDPAALWKKANPAAWAKADAVFIRKGEKGSWKMKEKLPEAWNINFGGLTFLIKPSSFKHTGLFPEQQPNWEWIRSVLSKQVGKGAKVLNLFAYTGAATLAAAGSGAEVVHLDASKKAIEWARENAEASGLSERPVRWILDDAIAFVKKEAKRGNKYDGIIMDPPAFGHGPKDEIWKIEESFVELFNLCLEILPEKPLFFLINGYASGYSPIAFENNLNILKKKYGGEIEIGELTIKESSSGRLLPAGIFARWQY